MEETKPNEQETPAPKAYRPKVTRFFVADPGRLGLEVPTAYDEMGRQTKPIKCESSEAATQWDVAQWRRLR